MQITELNFMIELDHMTSGITAEDVEWASEMLPDIKKEDKVIGLASPEVQRLYAVSVKLYHQAKLRIAEAALEHSLEKRKEILARSMREDAMADASKEMFWVALKDEIDFWPGIAHAATTRDQLGRIAVTMKKGFHVIVEREKHSSLSRMLFGAFGGGE